MAQEQMQNQGRTVLKPAPKEPRKYDVIILNDDFTTFEFVIMVMMTSLFFKRFHIVRKCGSALHSFNKLIT